MKHAVLGGNAFILALQDRQCSAVMPHLSLEDANAVTRAKEKQWQAGGRLRPVLYMVKAIVE